MSKTLSEKQPRDSLQVNVARELVSAPTTDGVGRDSELANKFQQ